MVLHEWAKISRGHPPFFAQLEPTQVRSIVVHKAFKKNYPKRYEQLRKTLEAAKDDPKYIKKAKKVGIHPDLIVDMSPKEIQGIVEGYWGAYEKYKGTGVFKKKKKKKKKKS